MLIKSLYLKIVLIGCFAVLFSCRANKESDELAHNHSHNHSSHEHHEGHHHDDEEEDAITIEPEKAEKLGIKVMEVSVEPFTEAIRVGGEITAPPSSRRSIVAHKSGILNLNKNIKIGTTLRSGENLGSISASNITGGDQAQTLKVEYDAAKRELDRLTPLYEQGVVSAKVYNEAKTTFEKAKLALGNRETASSALAAPASGTLLSLSVNNGDYVETGQTIGYIGDNATLTLRADLPKRYHSKLTDINDAFIVPACGDCEGFLISSTGGKRLDGNTATDNISGYLPVYFSFLNNGHIDGSGYVETYLTTNAERSAIALPKTALSEQQGQMFVYVQLDEDCYEKRPVTIGGSNGPKVEITNGIKPGESVVVEGVTFVKLAESAGVVPEGHSHTH